MQLIQLIVSCPRLASSSASHWYATTSHVCTTLNVVLMPACIVHIHAHESAPAAVSSNHWRSRLARVEGSAAKSLRMM